MIRVMLTLIVFFSLASVFAQKPYLVKKIIQKKIVLDGKLDEDAWQQAEVLKGFHQYFPDDKKDATYDTEIRMFYDDKNLYLSAKMISKGKNYIVSSYRRDFRAGGSDNITFNFDTFADHTNGFMFGANPYGVMREGLLYNGATDNSFLNVFWDNKWKVECYIGEDAWYSEAIIPFSTLRYKEGADTWFFKAYRFDTQSNESSALVALPQSQIIMSLGYTLPIQFEHPLKKNGASVALIPYVSSKFAKDFENDKPNEGLKPGVGFDAKIGVTAGLNLDLTINPDFSNVAADQQVVNLTRFNINLPEQRQFFLENSDLFTGFGSLITNPFLPPSGTLIVGNQLYSPFFSRNIGIGLDTTTGLNIQTRMNYGARLSGKIGDTWRVGLMNTQTAKDENRGIDAQNFTVMAVQKKVFQRSNIGAIFVNKFNPSAGESSVYNRVGGLEYNLLSNDNKWLGKIFYHQTFDVSQSKNPFATGMLLSYNVKGFIAKWSHDYLGEGFKAESGFVPRSNFFHINPTFGFNFFPKSKILNRYSFGFNYDQYQSSGIGITDRKAGPFVLLAFQNTVRLLTTFSQNFTYLFKDFDALRSNNSLSKLKQGNSYTYYTLDANLVTDLRKKVSLNFNPLIGQYYDGNISSMSGNLNYRFQPFGLVALNYSYNNIKLSTGKNKVYVIGPNVDLTMSKKLFLTNYVQYNSQFKNLNVNSRLQWRFAPVSDFFIVYTDNYNTEIWMPKSRAIFAKMTYWLSL